MREMMFEGEKRGYQFLGICKILCTITDYSHNYLKNRRHIIQKELPNQKYPLLNKKGRIRSFTVVSYVKYVSFGYRLTLRHIRQISRTPKEDVNSTKKSVGQAKNECAVVNIQHHTPTHTVLFTEWKERIKKLTQLSRWPLADPLQFRTAKTKTALSIFEIKYKSINSAQTKVTSVPPAFFCPLLNSKSTQQHPTQK